MHTQPALTPCVLGPPPPRRARAVNANDLNACSRAWFGWANAMLVALVESGLGWDCSGAAEQQHHAAATKGGAQDALYFGSLFAGVTFDAELKVPEYVGA